MPYIIWLTLLTLLSMGSNLSAFEQAQPLPIQGVLDLRGTTIDDNTLVSLNGEWEFHWNQLLTPESYVNADMHQGGIAVEVPSYWSSYTIDGQSLPGDGYGTYALKIILPDDFNSTLCFDVPIFDCAYHFYLNDRLINSNGKVATNRDEEEPWYEPSSFCYVPHGDTLQILIQVSNFHHRRGGFWRSILIGGSDNVLDRIERRRMYNYSITGVLFFFIFFFLIFWLFSKKEIVMLLFALTALGMLIRTVNTGLYFTNAFVYSPWSWQVRMEYFGTFLAYFFGILFLHRLFPRNYMKIPVKINSVLMIVFAIPVFILPVRSFSYEMMVFQPWSLLFLGHYLLVSLIGTINRKAIDAVFFVSLTLFIYTLVNDMLLASSAGAVHNNYLSQISFQLFIFAMAVMIIRQWVLNYQERLELESSLRFKNKVHSVIAHDLKNPIASIAQFTDLLLIKTELSQKQSILESLQESSQAAVNLLENLLYWSRSQSDELVVVPESFEVRKLVDEVISLFIHMSKQKELEIKTSVSQEIMVHADRLLVQTVVRNLVSNAIKFTSRNGNISISAVIEMDRVHISVSDTGIGIKPEIIEQFEQNGQLKSSAGTEKEHGTGLGLQLVRDLVQKNGGELSIKSLPGKGSTFTFTVPTGKKKEL